MHLCKPYGICIYVCRICMHVRIPQVGVACYRLLYSLPAAGLRAHRCAQLAACLAHNGSRHYFVWLAASMAGSKHDGQLEVNSDRVCLCRSTWTSFLGLKRYLDEAGWVLQLPTSVHVLQLVPTSSTSWRQVHLHSPKHAFCLCDTACRRGH